ncbi:zinc ribbon domain-containing protein [Flaviaesturariibacter amylovorans]|uniref:Zinc ribbon domain-containing protein n=1 Tax=Flaviaesturariibacter amylovorans TaxID=1084520 RepID=A0ABP8GCS8_9BACT
MLHSAPIQCPHCSTPGDTPGRFCRQCGGPLDGNADLFAHASVPARVSDKGYLLVALGFAGYFLLYFGVSWLGRNYLTRTELSQFIRMISFAHPTFLFCVLYFYSNRPRHRIVIGLIGLLVVGASAYAAFFG